jgi:hypothetical protein
VTLPSPYVKALETVAAMVTERIPSTLGPSAADHDGTVATGSSDAGVLSGTHAPDASALSAPSAAEGLALVRSNDEARVPQVQVKHEPAVPKVSSRADKWRSTGNTREHGVTTIGHDSSAIVTHSSGMAPQPLTRNETVVCVTDTLPTGTVAPVDLSMIGTAQSLHRQGFNVAIYADQATPSGARNQQLMANLLPLTVNTNTGNPAIVESNGNRVQSLRQLALLTAQHPTVVINFSAPNLLDNFYAAYGENTAVVYDSTQLAARIRMTDARSFSLGHHVDLQPEYLVRGHAIVTHDKPTGREILQVVGPLARSRAIAGQPQYLYRVAPDGTVRLHYSNVGARIREILYPNELTAARKDEVDTTVCASIDRPLITTERRQELENALQRSATEIIGDRANDQLAHGMAPFEAEFPSQTAPSRSL